MIINILNATLILAYGTETYKKEKMNTWAGMKKALSDSNKFLQKLITLNLADLTKDDRVEDVAIFNAIWNDSYTVEKANKVSLSIGAFCEWCIAAKEILKSKEGGKESNNQ